MRKNKYTKNENKRLWGIYHGIKKRCLNPKEPRYKDYGGRGIKMSDEWLAGFDNFAEWAYSHGYEDDLTIDRIDVDGNYCKENCRWITRQEQARNKRDTIWVTYKGETKSLKDWCEQLNLIYDTMNDRIVTRHWQPEKAFEQPSKRINSFSSRCRAVGLNPSAVYDRIHKLGWSEEEAFSTPIRVTHRGD